MSVTFVGAGAVSTTNTATIPTCEVGDLLIAVWTSANNIGATPSGWTDLGSSKAPAANAAWRTAVAGDSGGTVAFASTGGQQIAAVVAYRGIVGTPTFHVAVNGATPSAVPAGSAVLTVAANGAANSRGFTYSSQSGSNLRVVGTIELGGALQDAAMGIADWIPGFAHTSGPSISGMTTTAGGVVYLAWVTLPAPAVPDAPTLTSPANNASLDRTVTQRFSWTFSSEDPSDSQSEFDLRYSSDDGAAWTTVSGTTPNQYVDIVANTLAAGGFEWQVRTYGSTGLVGPWSTSSFFQTVAPPNAPTITDPTSGGTVDDSTYTVVWSAPNQTNYQARRVADSSGSPDTSTVYEDSGTLASAVARAYQLDFPTNGRYEHIQVRIEYQGLWSTWADVRVDVSYTAPEIPGVTVTSDSTAATMTVTWTAPTPSGGEPSTASANVWVRGGPEGTIRIAAAQSAAGSYVYRTPASGLAYEFQVVAVGTNGVTAASDWT